MIDRWLIVSISLLCLTVCKPTESNSATSATSDETGRFARNRNHTKVYRKKVPVCLNGKVVDGKCDCDVDYVGKHCEKKMNCETFKRFLNGTCRICRKGFKGKFCEIPDCQNGHLNAINTTCICDTPFTGEFCEDLDTKKIYRFYNNRAYMMGPLGALSLIPMIVLYVGCECMAEKRYVRRVGGVLKGQNIYVKEKTLQHLLTSAEDV